MNFSAWVYEQRKDEKNIDDVLKDIDNNNEARKVYKEWWNTNVLYSYKKDDIYILDIFKSQYLEKKHSLTKSMIQYLLWKKDVLLYNIGNKKDDNQKDYQTQKQLFYETLNKIIEKIDNNQYEYSFICEKSTMKIEAIHTKSKESFIKEFVVGEHLMNNFLISIFPNEIVFNNDEEIKELIEKVNKFFGKTKEVNKMINVLYKLIDRYENCKYVLSYSL